MNSDTQEWIDIFATTQNRRDMETLFKEIFTPGEIDTLTLRWQLLKDLYQGKTQRRIAAEHKISLCKITRGARLLKAEGGYLKKVLDDYCNAKERGGESAKIGVVGHFGFPQSNQFHGSNSFSSVFNAKNRVMGVILGCLQQLLT
jgi:TrpR family trp operon transcriptional repressor